MKKIILMVTAGVFVFAVVFFNYGIMRKDVVSGRSVTPKVQSKIMLYADFSNGSANAEKLGLIKSKEQTILGKITVEELAKRLSQWSGLDFTINSAKISGNSVTVDWAANSTLVAGLDNRTLKDDFHFYDVTSLNWFMLDSLALNIKKNLKINTVYYSMDGGKPLVFKDMPQLKKLPVDQAYEGSAFFSTHYNNKGSDENNNFTYSDGKNKLLLSYPKVFSNKGVTDKHGNIHFSSTQNGIELLYWVIPNTYKENPAEFIKRVDAEELQELEGNVVIGKKEDMDQKTGEKTQGAYYWVIDTDRIVVVEIICNNSHEVSQWYELLKKGAVYVESLN